MGKRPEQIAASVAENFFAEAEILNIKLPPQIPRASTSVDQAVRLIQALIDKGHAYPAGGDVYFRVRTFEGYGKLSKRKIDDLMAGARIAV